MYFLHSQREAACALKPGSSVGAKLPVSCWTNSAETLTPSCRSLMPRPKRLSCNSPTLAIRVLRRSCFFADSPPDCRLSPMACVFCPDSDGGGRNGIMEPPTAPFRRPSNRNSRRVQNDFRKLICCCESTARQSARTKGRYATNVLSPRNANTLNRPPLRFCGRSSRAVPQFTCPLWRRTRWLLLPPQRRKPVAGDPGKEKAT